MVYEINLSKFPIIYRLSSTCADILENTFEEVQYSFFDSESPILYKNQIFILNVQFETFLCPIIKIVPLLKFSQF